MNRRSPGFSLIELLVVLGIIGIITMAATNTWTASNQPAAVKGLVSSIYGALYEARNVARTNGCNVTITTTGHQATLTLSFPTQGDPINPLTGLRVAPGVATPAGTILTTWRKVSSGDNVTNYAALDTDNSWTIYATAVPKPDPLAGDVPSISSLFTGGVIPGVGAKLFSGSTNTALYFDSNGRAIADFWVYIGGLRRQGGIMRTYPSAPVGLILVTGGSGIHAFYKPNAGDPASPWQRL